MIVCFEFVPSGAFIPKTPRGLRAPICGRNFDRRKS